MVCIAPICWCTTTPRDSRGKPVRIDAPASSVAPKAFGIVKMCQRAFFGIFAVLLLASFAAPGASADTVKFVIDGPSGGRVLTLDSKKIDGGKGDFVSLQALVEQAGGAYNAIST